MRANCANILQAGNFVALFIEDRQQLAFFGGLALEGCLISFVSKQNIADLNLVANLLQPLADNAALDGDTGLGHQNATSLGGASSGRCGCRSSGRCGCGSLSRSVSSRAATQSRGVFAGVTDSTDICQTGYFVACFIEDVEKGACCGGFTFKASLIGFVGKQNIANVYGVANILQPFTDDTAFHGDARLGHNNSICQRDSSFILWGCFFHTTTHCYSMLIITPLTTFRQ